MSIRLRGVLALVAGVWLAGCSTVPSVPFDRAASPDVKVIALLTPGMRGPADVELQNTVGMSFGLTGLLIDAALKANREGKVNDILVSRRFAMPAHFQQQLADALREQGYVVVPVDAASNRTAFMQAYPTGAGAGPGAVQAYLDVLANHGYVSAGTGSDAPWRPRLWARVRLVSARDGSLLMQDSIAYNPAGRAPGAVAISPEPADRFVDMDALTAAPDKVVEGLQTASVRSAKAIAGLLK